MLASTLLFFLATNPYLIILACTLQGASQALVWVCGIAFLVSQVGESALGPAMGFITMCGTMGDLAGPLLGGPLYGKYGHWAVFGVVEALVAMDIFLRLLIKDKKYSTKDIERDETGEINESDPLIQNKQISSSTLGRSVVADREPALLIREWKAQLRKLLWEAVSSMIATAISVTIRCGLEATVPLVVLRRFGWSTSAAGGVIFALILPTVLGPFIGRYATVRWWNTIASFSCAILLFSLGNLTGKSTPIQILFVVHLFLLGLCITFLNNIHGAAVSIAAQRIDEKRKRLAEVDKDGEGLKTWGWKFATMSMILSGLSTAWSLGMVLGPVGEHIVDYIDNTGWMMLCWIWAALSLLCLTAGRETWSIWRISLSSE
ncbi:hypothetical protein AA313_de0202553 [Arthrobotrys entomopaga]|nr:hypothetical protein AA313_de0202553 [Arthrobotrys entomopaga]